MPKIVYTTRNGKKYKITLSPAEDTLVADQEIKVSFSGTKAYAHTTKSGEYHFYVLNWSRWEGVRSEYEILTKEQFFERISDRTEWKVYDNEPTVKKVLSLDDAEEL